jgi:hypothetical protein
MHGDDTTQYHGRLYTQDQLDSIASISSASYQGRLNTFGKTSGFERLATWAYPEGRGTIIDKGIINVMGSGAPCTPPLNPRPAHHADDGTLGTLPARQLTTTCRHHPHRSLRAGSMLGACGQFGINVTNSTPSPEIFKQWKKVCTPALATNIYAAAHASHVLHRALPSLAACCTTR